MKLAFSTLGCANWSFGEIYAAAKDLGAGGVEIRRMDREGYAPRMAAFGADRIGETLQKLRGGNVDIPLLASSAVVGVAERRDEALRGIEEYAALAQKLGARYVRVLAGENANDKQGCDLALARETLLEMAETAAASNVALLVETNGVFADTAAMSGFLDDIGSPSVGALWDMSFPFRVNGESPAESVANLGGHLKYVHVKDFRRAADSFEYCVVGEGEAPIAQCAAVLADVGYSGYLSLEWTRRLGSEWPEPGVVLAHSLDYMKDILKNL